jgi:outer membrane protein OmpA-like peptidoglycan-associated protein
MDAPAVRHAVAPRRRRSAARALLPALALILSAGVASAQVTTTGFEVNALNPMPSQHLNYFDLASAAVLETGQYEFQLFGSYARNPLVLLDAQDNRIESIVGDQFVLDVTAAVGIGDIFDIGVDLPLYLTQSAPAGNRVPVRLNDPGFGVGDLRIVPKLQLYNTHDRRHSPGGIAVAFLINGVLGTGDSDQFQGGSYRVEPRAVFDVILPSATRFSLNLGYMVRFDDVALQDLEVGDTLTYGLGMSVVANEVVRVVAEIEGEAVIAAEELSLEEMPLEGRLGLKVFPIPQVLLQFGGGIGLLPGYGTPDWRVFLGLGTSIIPPRDPDNDQVIGDLDQCPLDPEDRDGFEDADGCPDPDNDEDTVLDVVDQCPLDPEDIDQYEDSDGCSDPDNDGDAILDGDDECPVEPEDFDGFEDFDGCPDVDNDGDGILDVDDECALEPEDFDGWEDIDGCADPDNDYDGILDPDDACPLDPETLNDLEDEDGCPDDGLVTVTCDRIEIGQAVYFATNSDVIQEQSYGLLETVARTMVRRVDILIVRVEGHTDDRGSDSANLDLSTRRAASVMQFLIGEGVEPERLVSAGFGESQPIDTNATNEGRANNRRVEFVIVEQEGCQDR